MDVRVASSHTDHNGHELQTSRCVQQKRFKKQYKNMFTLLTNSSYDGCPRCFVTRMTNIVSPLREKHGKRSFNLATNEVSKLHWLL